MGRRSDERPTEHHFGPYRFQACPLALRRVDGADEDQVPLQSQPARLLELLLLRAGSTVTREEIRHWVWGADTHVDFDQSINFLVRSLRSTLGDDARAPKFIETVPRVGYRFVARVTAGEEALAEPQAAPQSPRSIRWLLAASIVVLLTTAAATFGVRFEPDATTADDALRSQASVEETEADEDSALQVSEQARDLYLHGMYLLQSNDDGVRWEGIEALEKALELEPFYLDAAADLAEALTELEDWDGAESWARRVLTIDPTDRRAHSTMALVFLLVHRDLDAAERHLRTAFLDEGSSSETAIFYSALLSSMGRHDEAIDVARGTVEAATPVTAWLRLKLAQRYFLARRYDEAIAEAEEVLKLRSRSGQAHWLILNSYLLKGQDGRALDQMNTFLQAYGWDSFSDPRVYWERTESNSLGLDPAGWAWLYVHMDDVETAFDRLEEAACADTPLPQDLVYFEVDPRLDALRGDSRFDAVERCVALPRRAEPRAVIASAASPTGT